MTDFKFFEPDDFKRGEPDTTAGVSSSSSKESSTPSAGSISETLHSSVPSASAVFTDSSKSASVTEITVFVPDFSTLLAMKISGTSPKYTAKVSPLLIVTIEL